MTTRTSPVLFALIIMASFFPVTVSAHSTGVIDLNPCSLSTGSSNQLRAHFDAFQDGRGPFCYYVPTTGDAQLVLEIYRSGRDRQTDITVNGASPGNDTTVFDPDATVYPGGIVSELIQFTRPGRYDVIVRQKGIDGELRFPLYVGITPPVSWRIKDAILDTVENPFLVLFVVGALLGAGFYWFSDPS